MVEKCALHKNPSALVGDTFDIETVQPDSVLIKVNGVNCFYKLDSSMVTHMPDGSLSRSTIVLSRRKGRKEFFRITMTSYFTNWRGRILIVKMLKA
jgi:hypothetical protein